MASQQITIDGITITLDIDRDGQLIIDAAATAPFGPRLDTANPWGTATIIFKNDGLPVHFGDIQPFKG